LHLLRTAGVELVDYFHNIHLKLTEFRPKPRSHFARVGLSYSILSALTNDCH